MIDANYTPAAKLFQDNWNLPDNPFPFLGADNYPEEHILSLFEIDRESTIRAFSLQNSIIEGSFGTGKTMLLKAIYSFHYSRMIVDLAEKNQAYVVPVYVKFSDLPYRADDLYREIILHTYKKILDTRFLITTFLRDKDWFDKFKNWLQRLTKSGIFSEDKRYTELSADTVTKRVNEIFKLEGKIGFDWLKQLGVIYEKNYETEIVNKKTPSITDIEHLHQTAFSKVCDKILLLIDEVDRLPIGAFAKENERSYSIYETFFNQLRTSKHLLYKVAVYPDTDSSNQVEGSRIGTRIKLGFNIKDLSDFAAARDFSYRILRSYLSFCIKADIPPEQFFHVRRTSDHQKYAHQVKRVDDGKYGDALEQLVLGSNGIVRRLIKLAGDSMLETLKKQRDSLLVSKFDVFDAMRTFGKELVERLQEQQRALVDRVAFFCIQKNAFRFRAIGNEKTLNMLYDPTKQDNVLYTILDQDRRGLTYIYEFDYCYCLYRNIPTHYFFNAEKVNKSRSLVNGKWAIVPVNVPQSIVDLETKLEGIVVRYEKNEGWGFVSYFANNDLFFHRVNVNSPEEKIKLGAKISFRIGRNYKGECAVDLEIL